MRDRAEDTVSERASKPNVVDFTTAATASRAPGSRRANLPDHPDAELIQACVEFGIAVRGASGSFEADPTGDSEFAQRMDTALLKRARKQQELIATLRPTTLDGLRAKATAANMARTSISISRPSFSHRSVRTWRTSTVLRRTPLRSC